MAKKIVEYKLHGGQTPFFISDGGFWMVDGKMIGVSKDTADCYVPASTVDGGELNHLDNQGVIDRVVGMDIKDNEQVSLTTEQKTAMAQAWLTERGF